MNRRCIELSENMNEELKKLYGMLTKSEIDNKDFVSVIPYNIPDNMCVVFEKGKSPRAYTAHWFYTDTDKSVLDLENFKVYYDGVFLKDKEKSNYLVVDPKLVLIPYRYDMYNKKDETALYPSLEFVKSKVSHTSLTLMKIVHTETHRFIEVRGTCYILKSKGSGKVIQIPKATIQGYAVYSSLFCPIINLVLKDYHCQCIVLGTNIFIIKYWRETQNEN